MKIHNLDIPTASRNLYRERLRKIKGNNLFFYSEDIKKTPGSDIYQSFGRVLHIRKLKTYTIAIFLTKSVKETLVLKGDIRKTFQKNVRRNDYIYVLGCKNKKNDILVSSFKIVSISLNLQGKNGLFLHERLIQEENDFLFVKEYSNVYSKIDTVLKRAGYIEIKSKMLQNSFYGGDSRPFETYSNDAHKNKYLKFSSEPVLKEMLVGGIDKAYEFGTVFRNEAGSKIKGEEIRALEFCSANENFEDFKKTVLKLVKNILDCNNFTSCDYKEICKVKDSLLSFKNFKSKIVPQIMEPSIIYNLPSGTSPFIACLDDEESTAKRELLIIKGMTIAEIYQNERDPLKQIRFLEKQFSEKRDYEVDYSSYIHSQLFGSPIINVCFISVDRLLYILTNQEDVKSLL